jgi:hypothetical protein
MMPSRISRDPEVGGERELEPAAEGVPGDRGDHRLGYAGDQ